MEYKKQERNSSPAKAGGLLANKNKSLILKDRGHMEIFKVIKDIPSTDVYWRVGTEHPKSRVIYEWGTYGLKSWFREVGDDGVEEQNLIRMLAFYEMKNLQMKI